MKHLMGWWSGVNRIILANAGSVAGTTAITSALGFLYWWIAARQFSAEAVGLAAAAISAMTLLANIATLGLGTWLMGELPRRPENAGILIRTMLATSGAAGVVLGILSALVVPFFSADLRVLGDNWASILLFAAGVSLTTASLVLDQTLIGLLRGELQMGRNAVFAVVKLVALIVAGLVLGQSHGLVIYATWVFGIGVSCSVLAARTLGRRFPWRTDPDLVRRHLPDSLRHHALNLALQVPNLALPMMVALVLSSAMNAYFYTTWMIAGFVFIGPFALTLALYAVGASDPGKLMHRIRFTLTLAFAIGVASNILLWLGADHVLALFGNTYADQGAPSLRILGLAVFGLIIKDHYVAVYRVNGRVSRAAVFVAVGGLIELALSIWGASRGGLVGLSLGWIVAIYAEAALMARAVYIATRPAPITIGAARESMVGQIASPSLVPTPYSE